MNIYFYKINDHEPSTLLIDISNVLLTGRFHVTLDLLEQTAKALEKSEWDIFKEICECSQIGNKRRDMLWDAWCGEDFIAPVIEAACHKILLGTVFPEGS